MSPPPQTNKHTLTQTLTQKKSLRFDLTTISFKCQVLSFFDKQFKNACFVSACVRVEVLMRTLVFFFFFFFFLGEINRRVLMKSCFFGRAEIQERSARSSHRSTPYTLLQTERPRETGWPKVENQFPWIFITGFSIIPPQTRPANTHMAPGSPSLDLRSQARDAARRLGRTWPRTNSFTGNWKLVQSAAIPAHSRTQPVACEWIGRAQIQWMKP